MIGKGPTQPLVSYVDSMLMEIFIEQAGTYKYFMNSDLFINNQTGYYSVGDQLFINKYQALRHATDTHSTVSFHWFDQVFQNVNVTTLGQKTLNQMYKERAQQLRDSYDYLILNYSGGCDSWNILKVFLDNNIHLDQVMVCWPFSAVEAKVYTPNSADRRVENFMSEWDFATKPDLDWLSKNHPEIKIELIDWADPFVHNPNFVTDKSFDNLNHFHNLADLARSTVFSKNEETLTQAGKRVATIWGLDKPQISLVQNKVVMKFPDSIITVAHPAPCNPKGTEYFYWTPNMPELAFEMALQTVNWFRARPDQQQYMWKEGQGINNMDSELYRVTQQLNQIAARDGCYTTWVDKFQVDKPRSAIRYDKDTWLYEHSELKHHVEIWRPLYKDLLANVSTELRSKTGYNNISTRAYYVCDF